MSEGDIKPPLFEPAHQVALLFGKDRLPKIEELNGFLNHYKQEVCGIRASQHTYVLLCTSEKAKNLILSHRDAKINGKFRRLVSFPQEELASVRVIPSQFGANPTAVARLIETTFKVKTTKVAAEKVTTHLVSGNVLLWVPKQDLEKIDKLSIKAEDHSFRLEVRGMAKPPAPKRTPLTDEERAEKRREKNRRRAEKRKALKEKTKETKEAAATLDSDSSPITPGPEGMDQDIPQPTASETPAAPLTAEPAGTKNPVRLTQADLNDLSPLPAITASREEENLFLSSIPSSMATALSTLTAEDLRSASTLPAALSAAPTTPAASQANRKREWQFSPTSPGASPTKDPRLLSPQSPPSRFVGMMARSLTGFLSGPATPSSPPAHGKSADGND